MNTHQLKSRTVTVRFTGDEHSPANCRTATVLTESEDSPAKQPNSDCFHKSEHSAAKEPNSDCSHRKGTLTSKGAELLGSSALLQPELPGDLPEGLAVVCLHEAMEPH